MPAFNELTALTLGYSEKLCLTKLCSIQDIKDQPIDRNLSFAVTDDDVAPKNLYCVHEVSSFDQGSGAVSRWIQTKSDGTWTRQEILPSGGADPAHVQIDRKRGLLYVTNYSGGSLSVFKLGDDGAIGECPIYQETIKGGSGVDPERQESSHLHGAFLYRDFAYVVDLGSDKIFHYKVVDEGKKMKVIKADPCETALEPGSGPRHLAIDHQRGRAYVLNELKPTIGVFKICKESGALEQLGTLQLTLPFAQNDVRQYGAGIEVHPEGKFLYVSNRGNGAMIVFEISDDARQPLKQVQTVESGGTWPRHFAITPDGEAILVADQFDDRVFVFKVDRASGRLTNVGSYASENKPSCVIFLKSPY